MLYLIATPIGNLADITFRALDALRECDLILCEDTRVSIKLLNHYEIRKPLVSFHQFSESAKEDGIIDQLKQGIKISLISDAGTPGISDPGQRLVKRCREEGVNVTPLPGPCAAIAAISASGLPTDRFQFAGFLPRKEGALKETLIEVLLYPGTTICYESAQRLTDVLETLIELAPTRTIAVSRELTKMFEEWKSGTAHTLYTYYQEHSPRGEIVLMIAPEEKKSAWETLTPEEHVAWLMADFKLSQKEAVKMAAEMRGVPKRDIYRRFIH